MNAILEKLKSIRLGKNSAPLALLAALLLAFGLLIPWLGFYQDDWHHVYYAYARGTGSLWELLNYDGRPFAGWVYVTGFNLLGYNPIAWQISTLLLRWLTVSLIWVIFQQIWPRNTRQNFTAALLFAIYPFFVIQPLSVAYALHWTGYLFYALSILLMLLAAHRPDKFIILTVLALAAETIHLFTLEYFAGIELLRPILLWLILSDATGRRKVLRILRLWLPYLLIFLLYFIWRGFIYHSPVAERGVPRGLNSLIADPLSTIQVLIFNLLPDLVLLLFSTWGDVLTPSTLDFTQAANLLIFALSMLAAGLAWFYLQRSQEEVPAHENDWTRQALPLGLAAVLLGLLPAYGGEYFLNAKLWPWNGRFAIASLFGAALLATVALERLISSPSRRRVVLALLAGLTIGMHTGAVNGFRHAWETETNFYRQLLLRVPGLAPHTAIISNREFLGFMGDYPTAFALNTIYAAQNSVPGRDARTWLFLVDSDFGDRVNIIRKGAPLENGKHSTSFSGSSPHSLVIYYEPDLSQCLWLITPQNSSMPIVPAELQKLSSLTDLSLITPDAARTAFSQIILPSQPDDWCAYFQRGDLLHQQGQWSAAVDQWEQAASRKLSPSNGFEILPFIDSYAQLGKWDSALELTRRANKISRGMPSVLCPTWTRLELQTPPGPGRDAAAIQARQLLACP